MASAVPVNVHGLCGKPFASKEIKQNCSHWKKTEKWTELSVSAHNQHYIFLYCRQISPINKNYWINYIKDLYYQGN